MASCTHSCKRFRCQTSLGSQIFAASQDIFVNIFERIDSFFTARARDVYRGSPNLDNDGQMTQITFDVLDIFATATKEMEQSRASKFDLRITLEDFSRSGGLDGLGEWAEEAR